MRIHSFSLSAQDDRPYAHVPVFRDGRVWAGTEEAAVLAAVSLRSAGDMAFSDTLRNPARDTFFRSLGLDPEFVAARTQTHSRDVLFFREPRADLYLRRFPPGDGLATNSIGAAVSVTVADCLPIFLIDTETLSIAALHSGWKGTGIVKIALDMLESECGTRADRVCAVLGPSIHGCCYRVDRARVEDFAVLFPEAEDGGPLGPAVRRAAGDWFIDLPAANARLLEEAGVGDLAVCVDCTFTDERLGSFRREGPQDFTRMAAVLATTVRGDE